MKEVKYLAENVSYDKVRPTKEVFNYYLYVYRWEEALRIFKLTEESAERILFTPPSPKVSVQHIIEPKYEQGNTNPK